MHRFRKKSDAKHSQAPSYLRSHEEQESPPELPPAVRTSLILPDLSRRFTLLRTSSGDPVSLEDLKFRFAEQRARGAENQISEEEEAETLMILETLGRLRSKNSPTHSIGNEEQAEDTDYQTSTERQSIRSSNTVASSSSPGSGASSSGRPAKRYSNNLFGSGRFRDYTYIRSVASQRAGSTRSGISVTPTESSLSLRENTFSYSDSLRPITPEDSVPSSSVQSSPNEKITGSRSAPLFPTAPYSDQSLSVAEYRLSKTLGPSAVKRASRALEAAIKKIEEEAEDEIVMPRSAPVARTTNAEQLARHSSDTLELNPFKAAESVEAGTAISSDKPILPDFDDSRVSPRASPIPSRTIPGYVPGMPRPMTPRSPLEEDLRSHSTTPRAMSPTEPSSVAPLSIASGLLRRDSNSSTSRHSPRPISPPSSSPLFHPMSTNGRFSPEEQRAGDSFSSDFDAANSSILGRRRPASPLSGIPYQPMAVSSRPGTPSNITWTPSHNQKTSGHSRNGSWVSDTSDRAKSPRSLRSPALPDSPTIDRGYTNTTHPTYASTAVPPENRPPSSMSGIELGSPVINNGILRSPTPTQSAQRSPTSPTFSVHDISPKKERRHSSKQSAPGSPFSLGPFHPFIFSPIANSSRTSLESAGSSYHSWDGEQPKDRSLILFSDVDPSQSLWHDLSSRKYVSETPGGSQDDGWDAEDIISRYAGLSKSDFVAIQEKLVSAAVAKTATPDPRDRAPSLRRRRPSTSQSNYSLNGREARIASPPPQNHVLGSPTAATFDQSSKANALLNSVVNSIQTYKDHGNGEQIQRTGSASDRDISPTSRRNRDLAKVLFGVEGDSEADKTATSDVSPRDARISANGAPPIEPPPNVTPHNGTSALELPANGASHLSTSQGNGDEHRSSDISTPSSTAESSSPTITTPYSPSRNLSMPKIPLSPVEQAQLAKEVQRKTEAAMVALRKSPSNPKFIDLAPSGTGSVSRRRISPNQISTPKLVSASTSVDTIPLRPPSASSGYQPSSSKLGQRFRKLRGTLRNKPTIPTSESVTPYPLALQSPSASQTAHYDSVRSNGSNVPMSAGAMNADGGSFRVPVPSPPASAGPGLKGFMARFRGKQRASDISHGLLQPIPSSRSSTDVPQNERLVRRADIPPPLPLDSPHPHTPTPAAISTPMTSPRAKISQETAEPTDTDDALKQLYTAASNLGLDQSELTDLLARKASTSSRSTDWTLLTRHASTFASRPETREENPPDRGPIPAATSARPSIDGPSTQDETRRLTIRRPADPARRVQDGKADASAVVRRTIIFPSESRSSTFELQTLLRKNSNRRRRASAASISSRSVHDRAPTPPPPRSPTARRFSTEQSPPMPQLPPSLSSHADMLLQPPPSIQAGGPIEKSSSTYDSLYEMYAGENKASGSSAHDPGPESHNPTDPANAESRQALEVIELANGETIWSIVNGLRDDDAESVYGNRTSFASEYSAGEGVQVFFKEHGRTGSKGSNSSFLSRKKTLQSNRPETKVFYSSSAQIGRLIENLSQGMESGSFNILPHGAPGHSTTSSFSDTTDLHWTVEERLEHMLGSMRGPG